MSAIYKRELKNYFTSPLGYVVLTVFAAFQGFFFYYLFYNNYGDITSLFAYMTSIAMFICPILTMRLMSEDKRLKVDQALLTAPVSLFSIVFGKFLAAFTVYASAFILTLVNQLIFAIFVTPDWVVYIGNLLGILLVGASLIAIGLFISSLTESQLVSAVVSFAVVLFILMMDTVASAVKFEFLRKIVTACSFVTRQTGMSGGVISFADIFFFVSITALFLFLSVRVLEKKRWA